jgi:hypothetical protein
MRFSVTETIAPCVSSASQRCVDRVDACVAQQSGGIFQCLPNVLILQLWILPTEFLAIRISRNGLDHAPHRHAKTADAGLAVQPCRVTR